MAESTQDLINRGTLVIKRHDARKNDATVWKAHLDEVAKYVVPRKDNVYGQAVPGEKRANRLFDTEAIRANDDLAAFLHGTLTPPALTWFDFTTGDKRIDNIPEVKKYRFDAVDKMIRVLNGSNFHTEILETFTDLGSAGTNSLRMDEDDEDIIRFHSEPIYNVFIEENNKGAVDTVSREFQWTMKQIEQEFGELSEELERALGKDDTKKHTIVHEVMPRHDKERRGKNGRIRKGKMGFPFKSTYVVMGSNIVLRESGFKELRYAISRWTKVNKEKYGRSPAMKVLADIKMINQIKKITIQGGQLAIMPPMQVPDNGFLSPLKFSPLASNYRRPGDKFRAEPLFTGADPRFGFEMSDQILQSINKAFFTDKFNVDLGDRATAEEVIQKRTESLKILGPIAGRLNRELLKPVIDTLFAFMERRNLLGEAPDILKQEKLTIKYVSSITQAQLAVQAENLNRALAASAGILQLQPEAMDNIDGDKIIKHNFETFNVDPDLLRSDSDKKKIREDRQAAMEAQEAREDTKVGADAVNKVGGTSAEGGQAV